MDKLDSLYVGLHKFTSKVSNSLFVAAGVFAVTSSLSQMTKGFYDNVAPDELSACSIVGSFGAYLIAEGLYSLRNNALPYYLAVKSVEKGAKSFGRFLAGEREFWKD